MGTKIFLEYLIPNGVTSITINHPSVSVADSFIMLNGSGVFYPGSSPYTPGAVYNPFIRNRTETSFDVVLPVPATLSGSPGSAVIVY
jgi:hypothetical protein